jgi:hypothetical protein
LYASVASFYLITKFANCSITDNRHVRESEGERKRERARGERERERERERKRKQENEKSDCKKGEQFHLNGKRARERMSGRE